jgi:hypothetical protein
VQPPGAHAVAQLLLELGAQWPARGAVEDDEEVAAEVVDSIHAARAYSAKRRSRPQPGDGRVLTQARA